MDNKEMRMEQTEILGIMAALMASKISLEKAELILEIYRVLSRRRTLASIDTFAKMTSYAGDTFRDKFQAWRREKD